MARFKGSVKPLAVALPPGASFQSSVTLPQRGEHIKFNAVILSAAKNLALGFWVEGPNQGEILRSAQNDSAYDFLHDSYISALPAAPLIAEVIPRIGTVTRMTNYPRHDRKDPGLSQA